jgi:ubiquinone/menaquinone biosynthesis C-methylase UbiE
MAGGDNAIPIEAWNTVLFDKFCRFRYVLTHGLSAHSEHVFARDAYPAGARVLDIGCGFGDTTVRIAGQVGPNGRAVGVDCARRFVELARRESDSGKAQQASFFVADVEADHLQGPYDAAFSRFGTMFFNRPGAAFRNIRNALVPGGELKMVVWRRREDNPWVHDAETLVKGIVPVVRPEDTEEVHCGPGPFSMTSADTVSDMLRSAGFDRIAFERFDADICIGQSVAEAVDFAMNLGPAGELIRLAGNEGVKRAGQVREALCRLMTERQRPGGIWMGSSSWLVSGRKPTSG